MSLARTSAGADAISFAPSKVASPPRWVVGVDIGGTKTRLLAEPWGGDESAQAVDVTVPSASWRTKPGDLDADARGLAELILSLVGENARSSSLVIGAHGMDSSENCRDLESRLVPSFAGPLRVLNDSELMGPAAGKGDAIGLVVGTGSIATTRDDDGWLITAGGWGWLLGDEGSAPALIREAVRAVLAHLDSGGPEDVLSAHMMEAFGANDASSLALAATTRASPEGWGAHAPALFAAAQNGSPLAADVIMRAGESLAALVSTLMQLRTPATDVVAGGSVIERQPLLQHAVRSALTRRHPQVVLHVLTRAPAEGALRLARDLAALDHTSQDIGASTS